MQVGVSFFFSLFSLSKDQLQFGEIYGGVPLGWFGLGLVIWDHSDPDPSKLLYYGILFQTVVFYNLCFTYLFSRKRISNLTFTKPEIWNCQRWDHCLIKSLIMRSHSILLVKIFSDVHWVSSPCISQQWTPLCLADQICFGFVEVGKLRNVLS